MPVGQNDGIGFRSIRGGPLGQHSEKTSQVLVNFPEVLGVQTPVGPVLENRPGTFGTGIGWLVHGHVALTQDPAAGPTRMLPRDRWIRRKRRKGNSGLVGPDAGIGIW